MRDVEAADPQERLAREKGVTYVKLDGNVGILGNGAGSRCRRSTSSSSRAAARELLRPRRRRRRAGRRRRARGDHERRQVRSIFFNIFGGITRCDEVARGILAALEQMKIDLPIVVRLDGTNAEEGRKILADAAPPNLYVEPTMLDAAQRAWSSRA
jgi:succinyl-CoA synthetase beta subunit